MIDQSWPIAKRLTTDIGPDHVRYRIQNRNGQIKWLDHVITSLAQDDSTRAGFIIVIRDVTERATVDEKLRQANERFSTVFRASPIGISIAALDNGLYVDVNQAFVEMYGFARREELIGKTSADLNTWANIEERPKMIRRMHTGKATTSFPYSFRHQSGALREALCAAQIIELDGEEYVLSMFQDVTEQKRVEAELKLHQQHLEDLVHTRTAELEALTHKLQAEVSVRLMSETAERQQRVLLEGLRNIAVALNKQLDLDAVLDEIVANIGRVVAYDTASLMLVQGDAVRIVRTTGDLIEKQEHGTDQIPLEESQILNTLITMREPLLITDTVESPEWTLPSNQRIVRSYIGVPLINAGEIIGFLDVGSLTPKRYTRESVSRLKLFAEQATVAIQNARLYRLSSEMAVWRERQVYLLDEAGNNLVLAAGADKIGRALKQRGHSIPFDREHSLVARCARTREGVVAKDVTRTPDFLPNPLLPDTKSEMAIPMVVGETLIGVLDVQADFTERFAQEDIRIKTILGNQIAVAVQNARSYAAMAISRQQAELLAEINGALSGAQDENGILEILMDFARQFGVANGRLYHIKTDENNQPIGVEAAAWRSGGGQSIPLSALPSTYLSLDDFPILAPVFADPDHPLFVENSQNDPRLQSGATQDFLKKISIPALIMMSLKTGDAFQGVVSLSWNETYKISQEMREVFTAVSPTASATLASVRARTAQQAALHESEKRSNELQTVAQVSAVATTLLNLDELLQTVANLVKTGFNLYHAQVYLLDEANENLVLAAGAGDVGRMLKQRGHIIPFDREHSLVARCARSREGVVANDVTRAPDFLPNPLLPDTKSEMTIPMVVGDSLIGVLDVQAAITNRFTDEDIRIKTTLADQIAVAVQNASLYQKQVQLVDQLQTVDRLKSEFLASMSHELRTPLNSIIGYSRMMLDGADGELEEEMHDDVDAIYNSGQHLLHLINDILDLAKIEAGRLELDPETIQISTIAEEVVQMTSV